MPRLRAPLMPGGGVARRPLHFIVMADQSGGMAGEKMQALNFAIADMLSYLAECGARSVESPGARPRARVRHRVRVAREGALCGVGCRLQATPGRASRLDDVGPAFRAVADAIRPGKLENRALNPAILLVTDGRPTDGPGEFDSGPRRADLFPGRSFGTAPGDGNRP